MRVASINTTLSCWLRLLWNVAPPLQFDGDRPFLSAGAIHLPPQTHWRHHAAAAAHAAAHLVYSPPVFDGEGVVPIARALTGLLEDARVEALAVAELPGLARLWRPLHTAAPETATDFEALMQRLARALADPGYDDPHPWVRKGRSLFFGGRQGGCSALLTAADVRSAALRLGHDIGQMRLRFNAKTYRVAPAYRDDHRWMWAADVLSAIPPPAIAAAGGAQEHNATDWVPENVTRYPEWDRLIARLRPDWCSVIHQDAPRSGIAPAAIEQEDLIQQTAFRLRGVARAIANQRTDPQRNYEGEVFDPGALMDWQVARRRQHTPESRVYRSLEARGTRTTVWLLIDQSASTADRYGADAPSVLQLTTLFAAATAKALEVAGVDCGVAGFSSNGRHAVTVTSVKIPEEPADNDMVQRLQSLRSGGSTRLGAVLRHMTHIARRQDGVHRVILLSDGAPYDIDVHDPRYLVEDARHAVRAAAQCGVRVVCLAVAADGCRDAGRIFGRRGLKVLRDPAGLPSSLSRLLA